MIEPIGPVTFRILGPLEIWSGGEWTGIGAGKWRALLAALLLQPGQPVPTDRLIAELWPDEAPARAANLVSVYVHRLRGLLEPVEGAVLATRSPGYQLDIPRGCLDAQRFGDLAAAGRRELAGGDPQRAAVLLADALALWRGPALVDVPPTPRVSAEAARLEESRIAALVLRIEADLRCGRAAELVGELRRLLSDHPFREELWALLMRCLHGAGRQAEALTEYARAREVIAGELGVDPGPELQRLHAEILSADARRPPGPAPRTAGPARKAPAGRSVHDDPHEGERADRPAGSAARADGRAGREVPPANAAAPAGAAGGRTPVREGSRAGAEGASAAGRPAAERLPVPAQLPADIPDFTGRAGQVDELCRLLRGDGREGNPEAVPVALVVGSGGLGKTTLAVHAAHLLAAGFPDGQLYAGLLGATQPADPAEVLARFLRDLGVDPAHMPAGEEERAAQFRTRLAGRRVLVVLDDARDAAQVRPLLPGSASCAVLITSRGRLPELVGARIMDLNVLPEEEARVLFARVAGEQRASAEPEATAEVLAACAGLPLAIRIAGARLAARGGWNVHYLAGRLADERRRLDELRAGNLAVRASFEVSFASLAAAPGPDGVDPARAFRLLGVWTGPSIPLPAAAALLGVAEPAAADALEVLVDAHLLDEPAAGQYRFHDLLRVYAADRARAQESEEDRRAAIVRVLTWYLHTAEAAGRVIAPQQAKVPLGPPPPEVRPLSFGSVSEALEWCEAQRAGLVAAARLAASSGLHELAWQLPAAALRFFYRRSHWADLVTTHESGLASAKALGDRRAEARMLSNLGIAYGQQRSEDAVSCFEQVLALCGELGDEAGAGRAANNVAKACLDLGRPGEALAAAQRSLEIQRRAGNRYGEGIARQLLGSACRELGRFDEAAGHLQQALAIFQAIGDPLFEADTLCDLGELYLELDHLAEALGCLRESLEISRTIGNQQGEAAALYRLGMALRRTGEPGEAADMLARALSLFEALSDAGRADQVRAALGGPISQAS